MFRPHALLLATGSVALAACEADTLEPWQGVDDGSAYLSSEPAEYQFAERARLSAAPATARLTHDGPPLPPGPTVLAPEELVVVDAVGDVRVVWESRSLQLLLWVDRGQLSDVVAEDTEATGLHADGDGFVRFPAGAPAEVVDREGHRRRLRAMVGPWRVEGWVSDHRIDQVWHSSWDAAHETTPTDVLVAGEVADAPGGEGLAWSTCDPAPAALDGPPVDGWVPIRWADEGWVVQGWVYEDDLRVAPGEGLRMVGGCAGYGWSCGRSAIDRPTLPPYTELRSDPSGPVVGQTLRPIEVEATDAPWVEVTTDTPWGTATLWAAWPPPER